MAYQVCNKCILDTNIPYINFNNDGVCNICVDHQKALTGEPIKDYERLEKKFAKLVKTNNKKIKYDCLCLYSGGKDSTNMLYNLVKKHNLKVLAFTLDNWFLSKQTYSNINKVLSKLNIDHIIFKPSWNLTESLFKSGIYKTGNSKEAQKMSFLIGHVCWPCFVMISIFSIKTALEKNIPNIIVGTTPGQLTQKESTLLSKYSGITDVYKKMILPFLKILDNDEKYYLNLSLGEKLKSLKLKLVPFYEYHRYCEEDVFKTVETEFGWQKPQDTDSCSSNCSINSLGILIHRKKYNISPYLIPLAHDVREGLVNREKAMSDTSSVIDENLARDMAAKLNINCEDIL
ncbi:MAG: hypothetical protein ABIH27_05315 [Candidatus Omnitrophota bacterium]